MNYMEDILKTVINLVLLIMFVILIIVGQTMIGYLGLGLMMIGLVGILLLLYRYNKSHA